MQAGIGPPNQTLLRCLNATLIAYLSATDAGHISNMHPVLPSSTNSRCRWLLSLPIPESSSLLRLFLGSFPTLASSEKRDLSMLLDEIDLKMDWCALLRLPSSLFLPAARGVMAAMISKDVASDRSGRCMWREGWRSRELGEQRNAHRRGPRISCHT